MEKNTPTQWSWIICNLPLKQIINGENVTWSLQPAITFSHPSGEGPDPIIKMLVDQEKSFQHTEELGWNWHKSWKLPTLSLQLAITDAEKGETLLCPKDIYVRVFAVKALVDTNNKLCLVDVGLRGTSKMELVDGKAIFQTLKFASTSYNNEGVKFHLLVCVYLQISEDTKPKILKAVISPPIFVDSRKSVKDNDKLNDNKLFMYVEPFYPDNFTRKFVKKENKKKEAVEEEIQNSVDGLFSYLTAPNIRNKVKHPIFLSVRFSYCISLYYNPGLVTEQDMENLVEFFQNLLLDDIDKGQEPNDIKLQDSYFVMYINKNEIEDKIKKKKILELLSPIKYKSLSVVFNKNEIPVNFVQIQDLKALMELYSKSYSKLLVKSKHYLRGDDENDDEDGPTDRIPPPERQTINFTLENPPRSQNDWNKYFDAPMHEEDPQKRLKSEDPNATPINMMEARTISYQESMAKLFPNGKDPASLPVSGAGVNPMMGYPGLKPNTNPLLMNVFPNKGTNEAAMGGMQQLGRGMMGNNPMQPIHGVNQMAQNPNAARFPAPAARGQGFGMDPMTMMMMMQQNNKMNQLNQLNMMGPRGQQFGGMQNFQQMMRGQQYPQMYQRDDEVKMEGGGDMSEINVKVQEGYSEDGRNGRRGNDINVKDEESMN